MFVTYNIQTENKQTINFHLKKTVVVVIYLCVYVSLKISILETFLGENYIFEG